MTGRGQWVDLQMGYFVQIPLAAAWSHDPSWLVKPGTCPWLGFHFWQPLHVWKETDGWLAATSTIDRM